jgi:steroid delta-isomerase-like uncharacterized protein
MPDSFMHEWFDNVWNRGDENAVRRLLAPNGVLHNLSQDGRDGTGPADFLPFYRAFRDAFPDLHVEVHHTATEGDMVFGRWTVTGTHRGHGLGFSPTNKPVSFEGMSAVRLENGQMVEGWNLWEAARMRDQLGFTVVPPAAS